ncbi:MAG: hypothetical protein DMG49_09330 [Acidobacteria bacterium]|nr:MAG: hypothetical protein DMG49_09330 [Acidobacteriota bacterium]
MKIYDFNERLKDSILIADGAMGSMLHEAVGAQRCFDELNSTEPEAVFRVHQAYIEAGAHIVETNTFGANRFKLGPLGLGEEVQRLNSRGVKIARDGPRGAVAPPVPRGNSGHFSRTGARARRAWCRLLHPRNVFLHRRIAPCHRRHSFVFRPAYRCSTHLRGRRYRLRRCPPRRRRRAIEE